VLLCFVDASEPFRQVRTSDWLWLVWTARTGYLSWQALNEFYDNAVRKLAVPPTEARFLVDSFVAWSPVDSPPAVIHRAWRWGDIAQVSHWDSLIVAAAELAGCSVLLSEDFQAGRQFDQLQVVDPFRTPA
jgi:predicted nucleic acid-binding protein